MKPEVLERRTNRIVEVCRAFMADPNDDEKRLTYIRETFNHDITAAVIVHLAGRQGEPQQ